MTALLSSQIALNTDFSRDVCDWLAGRRAGHMSEWLYSEPLFEGDKADGAHQWAKVVEVAKQGSDYYVFQAEQSIIQDAILHIGSLFDKTTSLVDLGPGSKDAIVNKIVPIRQVGNGNIVEYIGVDVAPTILKDAGQTIKQLDPSLAFKAVNQNFFTDRFVYPSEAEQIVACFFGLTICNMAIDPHVVDLPERLLTSYFSHLRDHMGAKPGYLLVTQDTNQDPESLRRAYTACARYFYPLLHRIARDVPVQGDFDPDAFDLDMRFFPETQAYGMCFVPKRDMKFSIDLEEFELKKGQELYFHNAFKFDVPTFQKAAFAGGFQIHKTIRNDGPCVLHVLKRA